ncbi:unnamed protein product [Calicophoron daubneyi]|uniref:Cadherin domain-containing protein n=1 Tax=Calicophoron daubneyi TaxID=300641 RepID=A0AAV2TJM8_CALDB
MLLTALTTNGEPNVFFVNDDTPAGHRIGRITYFNGHQNLPFDSDFLRCVLVRANRPPAAYFRLDETKGYIFTKTTIDREALCPIISPGDRPVPSNPMSASQIQMNDWKSISGEIAHECEFSFQVALHRKSNERTNYPSLPEFVDIKVVVVDRNDHVPTFQSHKFINLSVPESAPVGTRIRLPLAVDPDSPKFGIQRYQIFPIDSPDWSLYQQTNDRLYEGNLFQEVVGLFLELRSPLDREKQESFVFEIKAYDTSDELTLTRFDDRNSVKIYLSVEDINDNGPIFLPQFDKEALSDNLRNLDQLGDFEVVTYRAEVTETSWPKSPVLVLKATDPDSTKFAITRFDFAPHVDPSTRRFFRINEHTGEIFLRQPLDFEQKSSYSFDVIAVDGEHEHRMKLEGSNSQPPSNELRDGIYTATARVLIVVKDINDEFPQIELDYLRLDESTGRPATYSAIKENAEPPQFIADLLVTDKDANPMNNHVTCSVEDKSSSVISSGVTNSANKKICDTTCQFQLSEVRRQPGQVQYNLLAMQTLNREDSRLGGSARRIFILCKDSGNPAKTNQITVLVQVTDVNDNSPALQLIRPFFKPPVPGPASEENNVFLPENCPIGTVVARFNVTDLDIGDNGKVICSLLPPTDPLTIRFLEYFHVDPASCDVVVRKLIDREAFDPPPGDIPLTIEARDQGNPPLKTTVRLVIKIMNENDNPPILQNSIHRFSVKENLPAGTSVGSFSIIDLDGVHDQLMVRFQKHENLPFQLWFPNLSNSSNSISNDREITDNALVCYINTTQPLDREERETYEFKLLVIDTPDNIQHITGKTSRVHTTTATVFVTVEDVNDNDPSIIFPQQENKTFYLSNAEKKHYQLMTVNANDKDVMNDHFAFTLVHEKFIGSTPSSTHLPTRNQSSPDNGSTLLTNHFDKNEHKHQNKSISFLDIDRTTGTIYLSRDMSKDDTGLHAYHVIVQDADSPPRSASLRFLVRVEPVPPRSQSSQRRLPEVSGQDSVGRQLDSFNKLTFVPQNSGQTFEVEGERSDYEYQLKQQEVRQPRQHLSFPRLTGDAVLILSLGLILLLLLATLCLVIYARRWSTPVPTSSRTSRRSGRCSDFEHWFCIRFASRTQRDIVEQQKTAGSKFDLSQIEQQSRPWSPNVGTMTCPLQTFYASDKLGTPSSRETFAETADGSTIQRLCTPDRLYLRECRPFTSIPISINQNPIHLDQNSSDYTALQPPGRCQCCSPTNGGTCLYHSDSQFVPNDQSLSKPHEILNDMNPQYTPLKQYVTSPKSTTRTTLTQTCKRRKPTKSFDDLQHEGESMALYSHVGLNKDVDETMEETTKFQFRDNGHDKSKA